MAILFEKNPFLIRRIFLPQDDADLLAQLARTAGAGERGTFGPVTDLKHKIRVYFHGKAMGFNLKGLYMDNLTVLQRNVLCETGAIPYGSVRSYREIAGRIGRPRAARFVGATMARNPFPIIIPCHRVITSKGGLGGYGGGVDLKRRFLQLEGLRCGPDGLVSDE